MTKKKKGRKSKPISEKVKVCSVYLRDDEKKAVIKYYGSLTNAIRTVIPKNKNNE